MVDIETLLVTEHISEVVKVHPRFVASNLYEIVLLILQQKYENKSSEYGFIRKGSIRLQNIVSAQVEYHTLHGYVNVNAQFTASVFRPTKDAIIWTKVVDSNDFGYKASSYIDGESVLEIIIPKHMSMIKNVSAKLNDVVKVKLLDVKVDHISHKLSSIAHIIPQDEVVHVEETRHLYDVDDSDDEFEIEHIEDDDVHELNPAELSEDSSDIEVDDDEHEEDEASDAEESEDVDVEDADDEVEVDDIDGIIESEDDD